jgi:hypothetical protein
MRERAAELKTESRRGARNRGRHRTAASAWPIVGLAEHGP